MATSTPEASSERSVRKPVASTAFSSRATPDFVVEIGDRPGPEIVGQLGRGVPQLLLFTGQTDIHDRSFSTRRNDLSRWQPRDFGDEDARRLGRL